MSETINVDSVFLNFGAHQVLRGVSLSFSAKQVTGLVGRNGCGKSTFIQVITGQLKPQSKHLKYNGQLLDQLYSEHGLINYLPQHQCHPGFLRVRRLLTFYGVDQDSFFETFSFLAKYANSKFGDLSGGERRVFEVLMILESKSKFIILDEPFTHIMPKHVELVKERINTLKATKGILLTDHQYRDVMEVSDRLYLMSDGVARMVQTRDDLVAFGYLR